MQTHAIFQRVPEIFAKPSIFYDFLLEYPHMKTMKYLLVIAILLLSACQEVKEIDAGQPTAAADHDDISSAVVYEEAENIESVLAVYPPTWPEEVQIVVNGYLPDGCTEIHEINTARIENKFTVKIITKRQSGVMCTEALEPFEETIMLDTSGLFGDEYSVDVHGVSAIFTLDNSANSNNAGG